MNKTSIAIIAALALGALAPGMASGQQAPRHETHTVATKGAAVKKTRVVTRTPAKKKVSCTYHVQHGKKVRVCK